MCNDGVGKRKFIFDYTIGGERLQREAGIGSLSQSSAE